MKGILYGVGVGPGDPELLTLKAVRTIRECDTIAVPDGSTGEQVALEIAREYIADKPVLHCPLPMTRDAAMLAAARENAAELLCRELEQGKNIAYLTLGDASIYATYSYLQRLVAARGYETRVVEGIPSFCAAAAALGKPLCEGGEALHILPASYAGVEEALGLPGTRVLMKSGKSLPGLVESLKEKELLETTALVERCGMEGERVIPSLADFTGSSGYFSVVIVKEKEAGQ